MIDVKAIGKSRLLHQRRIPDCKRRLRAYLLRRDALPQASLIAGVPVSVRQPGDRTMNTQVMTQVSRDADRRSDRTSRGGARIERHRKATAQDIMLIPADLRYLAHRGSAAPLRAWERAARRSYLPPLVNLVISNVPGARSIRYSSSARVSTHFPVSIPARRRRQNITVQSYAEHFDIGITACARTVPDVALRSRDLLRAYIVFERVEPAGRRTLATQPNVRERGSNGAACLAT